VGWGQHGILGQHNSLEGSVKCLLGTILRVPAPVEVAARVVAVAPVELLVVAEAVVLVQVVPLVAASALRQVLDRA
jgi:hypothetical protein